MEPRPHERGNPDERVVDEGLPVASMEPRPHERGNFRDQVQVLDVGRASMEPRPHERGNEKTKALKPPQLLKLQWSHVLTNVETRRLPARLRRHHNGFNGATSSRTWKPFFDFAGQPGRHLLQWSHVLTNVETQGAARESSGRTCFNGATSSRTWKRSGRRRPRATRICFNGATSSRTWNHVPLAPPPAVTPAQLQWSHVLTNVETSAAASAKRPWSALQWSHVLTNVET